MRFSCITVLQRSYPNLRVPLTARFGAPFQPASFLLRSLIFAIVVGGMGVPTANAAVIEVDTTIDGSFSDSLDVFDNPVTGQPTTLTLTSNASVSNFVRVNENSIANIAEGAFIGTGGGQLQTRNSGLVTSGGSHMSGGQAFGASIINLVAGSSSEHPFFANDSSTINISGGFWDVGLAAFDSAVLNISGGGHSTALW